MKLSFSPEDEIFRSEVANWLKENLTGEFAKLKYRGGPGDEHMFAQERKKWEQKLAQEGWTCVGWPKEYGGRGCSIEQQVIFHEEYARAGAPGHVGHIGEGLVGPTLIAFGTEAQKQKYLPGILCGKELWCQGYSEPGAGSDLANVKTRARFDDEKGKWIITGQKVWTSLAHEADYCFVIARTDPGSVAHKGLGFFLVPMDQPGVEVRSIQQITGTSEFNEVFITEARVPATNIIGNLKSIRITINQLNRTLPKHFYLPSLVLHKLRLITPFRRTQFFPTSIGQKPSRHNQRNNPHK